MNLKGRIPVEQLDDERMTNIERRIVAGAAEAAASAPSRSSSRLFGWGLAFAMAAAIAIGAGFTGWMLRGEGSRNVTTIANSEPVHVHTTSERSVLDIGDARIESDPLTDFTVTRPDGGVLVTMTRGKVELTVGKRGDRPPLVVAAGDTRVIVVGTKLSVDYGDGTNGVDVRVTEGVVKVERLQQEVRVAAGQAWTTRRGVVAIAELPQEPELSPNPDLPTIKDDAKNADDRIEIETDAPDVLKERKSSVPDATIPTTGVHHGSGATRPTKPDVHRDALPSGGSGSVAVDLRDVAVLPPLELPGVEPKDAVATYRDIVVKKKGDEASLAFYSIAWMQHMKLGRNGDALQTLDQYLRRFVGGKEYAAALWLRVRILCAKNIDERCRQAAYAHMHQASGTPAAKVSEALTLAPRL